MLRTLRLTAIIERETMDMSPFVPILRLRVREKR